MSYWNGWDVNEDLRWIGGIISAIVGLAAIGVSIYGMYMGDHFNLITASCVFVFWIPFILCAIQPNGFRVFGQYIKRQYLRLFLRKPNEFNLQVGMTNKQIYKELHMKTAGETEQEVQYLLSSDHSSRAKHLVNRAANIFGGSIIGPALEVIEANDKHAVIRKTRIDHNLHKEEIYYLTGINDEGYYFVHAIESPELQLDKSRTWPKDYSQKWMTLDRLVSHINRVDEGFQRLQGDVLYKLVPIEHNHYTYDTVAGVGIDKVVETNKPNITPIELGNHQVFYTGEYWSAGGLNIIVGTKAIMKHPQHKDVTVNIPDGQALVLTHQRSRNVTLPNSFGRSNYD